MRTQFLLTVTLLVLFTRDYSQSKKADGLNITIGPSLPIGKYAEKDAIKTSYGFAKAGEAVNISYVHLSNNKFGWSIALHGQKNPLNTKAYANAMSQLNYYEGVFASSSPNPNPPQGQPNKYGNWKFDKNSWSSGSILLGAYGQSVPAESNKFCLTAKVMMGAIYVSTPELNGKSTSDTVIAQLKRTGAKAFGLAYIVNGGVKFKLNDRIYFLTEVEYFGTSDIIFKNMQATFTSTHYSNGNPTSANSQMATGNVKQTIASINLNIGIAIRLK
jgi:hypothetical protein